MAILDQELQALGMRVHWQTGTKTGGSLAAFGTKPSTGPRRHAQLLLGHCDTVWPIGTTQTRPPVVVDGQFQGPGSYDMKAGLVQGIFALQALASSGIHLAVTPVFVINSDEEIGSHESRELIVRIAKRCDRVFVLEPSQGPTGALKTGRKGIGRFTVRVRGRAAHAGLDPEKGASAILELASVIQRLFALNDAERKITVNVGMIDGGLGPNVIAPESRAVVDVRVSTLADAEEIQQSILSLTASTAGTEVLAEGHFGRPPMEQTPGNQSLFAHAEQIAAELGLPITQAVAGGGSDGNFTSRITPTLDGLGAVGEGAHSIEESVRVNTMAERAALLGALLALPPIRQVSPRSFPCNE